MPIIITVHMVLFTGHRIDDGLVAAFGDAWHDESRPACVNIDLEVDGSENRIMNLIERGREHLETVAPGSVSSPLMIRKSALIRPCPLIGRGDRFTTSLMDGSGPAYDEEEAQIIKSRTAVKSLIDEKVGNRFASPVRRPRVELARGIHMHNCS